MVKSVNQDKDLRRTAAQPRNTGKSRSSAPPPRRAPAAGATIAAMDSWINSIMGGMGYWGVALLMLLENVFPPIPSELIMPMAGFAAASGRHTIWGVWVAGV